MNPTLKFAWLKGYGLVYEISAFGEVEDPQYRDVLCQWWQEPLAPGQPNEPTGEWRPVEFLDQFLPWPNSTTP